MNTDDEREALARVLHADDVARDRMHADWDGVRSTHRDWYFDQADAILAVGFRRQGPITDAQVEAASVAFGGITSTRWEDASDWEKAEVRDGMRRALEAARAVQ